MMRKSKKKIRGGNNKTKKRTKFIKLNCSPDSNGHSFSCYSKDDLYLLKNIWNNNNPHAKIKTSDPKEIWKMLKFYLKRKCDKESCWAKSLALDNGQKKHLLDSFSPQSPLIWKKNPNEWLSSVEIINVMKQYEKAYKCFKFIGPSPIDFDNTRSYGSCVWEDLCKFNLQNHINKNKNKIGIIFNTDPHYKDGEHWISLFINCKKKLIFFFDSVGNKPPEEILKLVRKIQDQGRTLKKPIEFQYDENHPFEHQMKDTECGVYSLYFLVHMLKDKLHKDYLKTKKLPDEYIEKFRKIYFNPDL